MQWTTVCLLLYTVLTEGWAPCQVDYTNTFSGVDLNEDIYIEYPCLSEPRLVVNSVLQLCKSLHGICQAHQTFYENVKAGLEECRFVPSVIDPSLLMDPGIMCVVCVDDTIFVVTNSAGLHKDIVALYISIKEQCLSFQLHDEGVFDAFLGIHIVKTGEMNFCGHKLA